MKIYFWTSLQSALLLDLFVFEAGCNKNNLISGQFIELHSIIPHPPSLHVAQPENSIQHSLFITWTKWSYSVIMTTSKSLCTFPPGFCFHFSLVCTNFERTVGAPRKSSCVLFSAACKPMQTSVHHHHGERERVVWKAARKESKHQSILSEGILLISVSIFKLCPVFLCPLLDTQREMFTFASDMTSGVLKCRSRSQIPGQDPVEPAWEQGFLRQDSPCKSQLSKWLTETAWTRKELA